MLNNIPSCYGHMHRPGTKKKDAFAAHTAIPMEMYWFLDAFGTQLLLLELSSYVAHGF